MTRCKFIVQDFEKLLDEHYLNDADAIRKLETNQHTLKKLKEKIPTKKSTCLKVLKRHKAIKDNSFDPFTHITEVKNR